MTQIDPGTYHILQCRLFFFLPPFFFFKILQVRAQIISETHRSCIRIQVFFLLGRVSRGSYVISLQGLWKLLAQIGPVLLFCKRSCYITNTSSSDPIESPHMDSSRPPSRKLISAKLPQLTGFSLSDRHPHTAILSKLPGHQTTAA